MKQRLWLSLVTCVPYCIDRELYKAIDYLREQVRVLVAGKAAANRTSERVTSHHKTARFVLPIKRHNSLKRRVTKMSPQALIFPEFRLCLGHFLAEKSTFWVLNSFQCTT